MAEAIDSDEVDKLIASMELTVETAGDPHASVSRVHIPLSSLQDSAAKSKSPRIREETAFKKPPLGSTLQDTPRLKRERSVSSGSSFASARLPLFAGTTEPPFPSTFANSFVLSPSSTNNLTSCDLDALGELLQAESLTSSLHRDVGHSSEDRVSSEPVVLPLLLSSPQKSFITLAPLSPSYTRQRSALLEPLESRTQSMLMAQLALDDHIGLYDPPHLQSQHSVPRLDKQILTPSRRRLTIGTHEISPHALERLGVNTDMLKKEKGMKKLGISDLDIERFEEIRRYSGVPHSFEPVSKVEFMFGFTREQLLRVKAINRLGTTEQEVQDEFSRQISRLGVHDVPIVQH